MPDTVVVFTVGAIVKFNIGVIGVFEIGVFELFRHDIDVLKIKRADKVIR
ncbi:hypothetical protein [uncultured Mucilaginibacter sp.]|nr:hypothetical protein [uncultured Mucilaginibacter sp.]